MSERLLGVFAALLMAGCAAVGPDYVAPPAPTDLHYTAADPARADAGRDEKSQVIAPGAVAPAWWQAFGSRSLDEVVARALAGSPALAGAAASLGAAQQAVAVARGALAPQVTAGLAAGRGNTGTTGSGPSLASSSIGPAASWSIDAFGAGARRVEQAQALADAQAAQWRNAWLTAAGGAVNQAIALASAIEQQRALDEIVAADRRNLELVRVSKAAGASAGLDVLTAQSQLASDLALRPPLQQQADAARHALAVLAGTTSAQWTPPDFDFQGLSLPQSLPLALPSAFVHERPDILAAEAQLHAANAAIGIATAALYPSLTINASWTAAQLGGAWFGHPESVWDLAAALVAPVFSGGALQAGRAAAVGACAAALENYRQTVVQAFGQVADALSALDHDAALLDAQRRALDAARTTLDLTQQSFEAGQSDVLQILQAQRLFEQARQGYARAQAQRYADSAQLFIAQGGGKPQGTP